MSPDTYLDALLSLPALDAAAISRDGTWAAWTWWKAGSTADVYAAPTDGSAAPIRLTDTSEDTTFVAWTLDGRAVLVQQDHDGDERAQLFRVDLDRPGVMVPLTEPSPNYFLRGGQPHPNGRWLIYGANVDEQGNAIEPTRLARPAPRALSRALADPLRPEHQGPPTDHPGPARPERDT